MERNMPAKVLYFGYFRRSVEKKDGEETVASVESQKQEMFRIAKERDLEIIAVFEETRSAKTPGRPLFDDMIKRIEKGEANGIICFKIDRLARNPIDAGKIQYLLQTGVIQNIKASDRDWFPDDNVLVSSVEFGVSNQFVRDLSKHVKRGLRARLDVGVMPSRAPLGYRNSKYREKGKEEILIDEERFHLVRKMFDSLLSGKYTPLQVLTMANDDWGLRIGGTSHHPSKKISTNNFYKLLKNPFYYGDFEFPRHSGNWYHGTHTPMITRGEYERVQYILDGKKGRRTSSGRRFAYTGIMRCGECGAFVTAEEKWKTSKTQPTRHYILYHCTKRINPKCSQKCINENELNRQIDEEYLANIEIPQEFHDFAIAELSNTRTTDQADAVRILGMKRKAYSDQQNKLDALLDMRLSNEITPEFFNRKKTEIEREMASLKEYIEHADVKVIEWFAKAKQRLSFAVTARQEFKDGDSAKRREILLLLGSNHTLTSKKLYITIEKPLLLLSEVKNLSDSPTDTLEPQRIQEIKDSLNISA